MTTKQELAVQHIGKIELGMPVPEPVEELDLIQQGLVAVLLRRLKPRDAVSAVRALIERYPDWNEMRVSQAQEIALAMGLRKPDLQAARMVKSYLQEIFQQSHGLELEFLREDATSGARFISQLTFLGQATANYLLYLAQGRQLPITSGLMRVLDRLGLIQRTASIKKARAAIEPLIPDGRELEFLMSFGQVAALWCDPRKPTCWKCVLVDDCRHGKKVKKDWQDQQARLAAQRAREEARQEALRKKEDARRRREEERDRKQAEARAAKQRRELERRRKIEERKREAAAKTAAREKAREESTRKREAERKKRDADRKKREAERLKKKKQAEKKKAADKARAAKQSARSKAAASKSKAKKKTPARRPAAKKGSASKTSSATRTAKRKPAAKKPVAKKKVTPKRKSTVKPAARKKPARKGKNSTTKAKKTTRKNNTRKRTTRR